MSDTILAVDLGRHKSVACVYHRGTREHAFRTLDTTPADRARLLARHPGALVKGRITRRGPGVLRKLLVECAWCMLRSNPWARSVSARLTAAGG